MPITRVFVMGLTSLLTNVVRAVVANQPGLELAGESAVADFALAAANHSDMVVVAEDRLMRSELYAFLSTHCRVGVLGLTPDSGTATLYEMRPHRIPLGELGTDQLAAVLAMSRSAR